MKKTNYNTRVIDLTLGELLEAIEGRVRSVLSNKNPEKEERRYVYGLKGLAKLFGCSKTTASRIKTSGKIDKAITQIGSLLIIDATIALEEAAKNDIKTNK